MKFLQRLKSWLHKAKHLITGDLVRSGIWATTLTAGLIITVISGSGNAASSNTPKLGHRITVNGTTTTVEATPTYSQPTDEIVINPSVSTESGSGSSSTTGYATAPGQLYYTPASTDALEMSPSSITVYKNTDNTQGLKSGVTSTAVQMKSGNGKTVDEPYVTGNSGVGLTTADSLAARSTWPMEMSAGSAALGSYFLTIEASGTNGVTYSGNLIVNVVSVPTFTLPTNDDVTAVVHPLGSTNTATFTGLGYSAGTSGGSAPTISATNLTHGDITCSSALSYTDSEVICSDPNIQSQGSPETVPMEFTFQNQFQEISIGGELIITNTDL